MRELKASGMNHQEIRDFITSFFRENLVKMRQRIEQEGSLSWKQKRTLEHWEGHCKAILDTEHYEIMGANRYTSAFIKRQNLPIEEETPQFDMLRSELFNAGLEYTRNVLELDNHYNTDRLADTEARGAIHATPPKKKTKLAEAIKAYIEEKERLESWATSSLVDYRVKFDLLLEYLGDEAKADIDSKTALDVKNMLIRLPKDRTKKTDLKDLKIHEQLETDAKLYQRLSASSVNQHLSAYSSLYEWLLNRDQATKNPYKRLLDNVSKKRIKRDQFTQDQIDLIMPIVMKAKPHLKWGTLIAFYTGARLNEIAQLDAVDIIEVAGIPCFNITDDEAPSNKDTLRKKRLKNASSKRIIPIHSKLIELGLLDHVKARKADSSPETKLFVGMGYDNNNGHGRNLGRWFRESVLDKQLGIKTKELVFHSIRHTVARKLRHAEVALEDIANILGHSQQGVTAGVYAPEQLIPVLKERIERLDYGDAVSAHIKPQEEDLTA